MAGFSPFGALSPGVLDFTPSVSRKVEAEEGALSARYVTSQTRPELPGVSASMFAHFHPSLAAHSSLAGCPTEGHSAVKLLSC